MIMRHSVDNLISGTIEGLLEDLMDRDPECLRASCNTILHFLDTGAPLPRLKSYRITWDEGREVERIDKTMTIYRQK